MDKERKTFRKKLVALVGGLVVVGTAGAAFAYFTSTGSGTSNATVGSATNWTVTAGTPTGGPLYPGSGTVTVAYTITNPSSGHQMLNTTTAALTTSGLNVVSGGSGVSGCLASWFVVTNTPPTATDLAGGASLTGGSLTVTMTNVALVQDLCQGVLPQITISAS